MALIICKECGKKVSDTTTTCIHCGAPILVEKAEPEVVAPAQEQTQKAPAVEAAKENSTPTQDKIVDFNSLGEKRQEELVHAFWEDDKIAKRYQKKRLLLNYLAQRFDGFTLLPIAFFFLIHFVFKLPLQNAETAMILLAVFAGYYVFSILKLVTFAIIRRLTVNRKDKRLAYEKRFAIWAKEKHQIAYNPILIHAKDELMYEQINIDTFKL